MNNGGIIAGEEDKLFKIGVRIWCTRLGQLNLNLPPKTINVDLSDVVAVGGSAVVFKLSQNNVMKAGEIEIPKVGRWNTNRIGKEFDGTVLTGTLKGFTYMYEEEGKLLNSFEHLVVETAVEKIKGINSEWFGWIINWYSRIKNRRSTDNILQPIKTILQRIQGKWLIINGKEQLYLYYSTE